MVIIGIREITIMVIRLDISMSIVIVVVEAGISKTIAKNCALVRNTL